MVKATASGIEIDVRVIPRASKTTLGPTRDDALVVRVAAPPVDNAANEALVDFFSELFGVPARAVRIVAGARGRRKRVAIDGISIEKARVILVG
ncbi:MAG TPA: DUF167 domain-containing protein [Vicinamibacterales bacterium]